jgi:glycosyltransferase involved in cell wall biosynthesis
VVALRPSASKETHDIDVLGRSRRSVGTLRSLRDAARSADVVVAHGSSTLEACAVSLVGSAVPFVYRTIGDPTYWVTSPWRQRAIGGLLRRATRTVVLWPAAAELVVAKYGIERSRVDVIPNGVPPDRFRLSTVDDRVSARQHLGLGVHLVVLAFVGALSVEKDVTTAIRALAYLEEGAVLLLAGDGPEYGRLERVAREVAPGRVRFLGPVKEPRDVYAAADLLVLPSLSEGMPAVVIEAGFVGVAAVASTVGAVPEMIDDGRTGFLVPPGDPKRLGIRIAEALPHAAQVGRRAAEVFADRYEIGQVASQWHATLERACRCSGSTRPSR